MEIKDNKIQLALPITVRVEFGLSANSMTAVVQRIFVVVDGVELPIQGVGRLLPFSPGDTLNIEIPDHLDVSFS